MAKKKVTQTEAVRLAILKTLEDGKPCSQEAFWQNVQMHAATTMSEVEPDCLWGDFSRRVLLAGAEKVPNLRWDNSIRSYYLVK